MKDLCSNEDGNLFAIENGSNAEAKCCAKRILLFETVTLNYSYYSSL